MDLRLLAHKANYGSKGLTLENLDDDLPEGGDGAIGSFAEECDQMFAAAEGESAAIESIREYTEQLEGLIVRKEVSMVALSLIRKGVDANAQRLGREVLLPALESVEDVPLEAQATIALEGFKNFLNNVIQEFVLGFKHQKDTLQDFLRTVSDLTAKYEKKTLENKRHWNDVKGDLAGGEVSVGANGLLYFFAKGRDNGTVGKLFGKGVLLAAMKEDLATSKYILTQYPKAVIGEIKSLANILRGTSITKPEDMLKMAAAVEKLKTPTELFDKKYHGADLLGATSLNMPAAKPKAIKHEELAKKLGRLSEMSGSKQVGYTADKNMTMLKGAHALGSAPASIAMSVAVPGLGLVNSAAHHLTSTLPLAAATSMKETSFTFDVSDISTVFEIAESYLDNVRACIGLERELVRAIDELDAAAEKVNNASDALVDRLLHEKDKDLAEKGWNDFVAACHVFDHVMRYGNILRRALQRPAHGELARALRASKYCNYLGLRAIYNAERKESQPANATKEPAGKTAIATESESLEDAKYKKGDRVDGHRVVDVRLNGPKRQYLLKPDEDKNEYATADEHDDGLEITHRQSSHSDEAARTFYNFTGKEKVSTEGYDEEAQENIRKMDEALDAVKEKYHKLMLAAADDPKKHAELGQKLAVEEYNVREKFKHSHPKPATESVDITLNEQPEAEIHAPGGETPESDNTSRNNMGLTMESDAQQENIRQMDEALDSLHSEYHGKMTSAAGDPKKFSDLRRELADKEYHVREKYKNQHPSD